MNREFEFKKERKGLADSIREQRKARKSNKEIEAALQEVRQSEQYSQAKSLHTAARDLPTEAVAAASSVLDVQDDPEKWEVIDLHPQISPEYRALIDAEVLIEANNIAHGTPHAVPSAQLKEIFEQFGMGRFGREFEDFKKMEEFRRRNERFIDTLTQGRFLNRHNFNHVVGAQGRLNEEPFNRYSAISFGMGDSGTTSEDGTFNHSHGFWLSTRGSDYAHLLARPIVICSPNNPGIRRLLRKCTGGGARIDVEDLIPAFLSDKELPRERGVEEKSASDCLLDFRRKDMENEHFTWMDIADCILDLKAEKMWIRKYSEQEKAEVEADIAKCRAQKWDAVRGWSRGTPFPY